MKSFYIIYLLSFVFGLTNFCFSQDIIDDNNYVQYSYGYFFYDGLYLSDQCFLNNSPTPFEAIVSPQFNQDNFFSLLEKSQQISFNDDFGNLKHVNTNEIWGYCKNGRPHIYFADKFNPIPYIGIVSHFVATVRVVYETNHNPFYSPYDFYGGPDVRYQDEIRQFLIDFENQKVIDFNVPNCEYIIKRDSLLFKEFDKLRKRKKNKLMFYYIRQYNERNPLYLPKNKK
jgi:hypothetical protein